MGVQITEFGTTAAGSLVHKITLTRDGMRVSVLTKGATLQSVRLDGVAHDLTLGSDDLALYEGKMRHHGSLVAPVVNRFTGGRAVIGGADYQFETNQDGKHTLHFGAAGTQHKIWAVAATEDSADACAVTLALTLPEGEGGMPGTRPVRARFSLEPGPRLRLHIHATTDALTLFNAANHSYWNMDGSATWLGHALRIAADQVLPVTDDFAPTGEVRDVTGTHFDLRVMRDIVPGQDEFDHNFCLGTDRVALRDVLWLRGQSGLTMTIATTEAGIQVYDGRNAKRPGRGVYEGLAIEPQNWPDAPNHAGFPSIELAPGQAYDQITEWRFAPT